MANNMTFIAILAAMLLAIGCTQLGLGHEQSRNWKMTMEALPDGECRATMSLDADDIQTDETITVDNIGGG